MTKDSITLMLLLIDYYFGRRRKLELRGDGCCGGCGGHSCANVQRSRHGAGGGGASDAGSRACGRRIRARDDGRSNGEFNKLFELI